MRDCIRDVGNAGVRGVNVLARCSSVRPEALGLLVSPVYAHGSCYATNRILIDARWLLSGPAVPFLSTTRAARPRVVLRNGTAGPERSQRASMRIRFVA